MNDLAPAHQNFRPWLTVTPILCMWLAVPFLALAGAVPKLINPSFEADAFGKEPGSAAVNGGKVTGWEMVEGNAGVNPWWKQPAQRGGAMHSFSDNGKIPHGRQVLFLQNKCTIKQLVKGLRGGRTYRVHYHENGRAANQAPHAQELKVSLGGVVVVSAHEVKAVDRNGLHTTPYCRVESAPFTAPADGDYELVFETLRDGGTSLLIDDVSLEEVGQSQSAGATAATAKAQGPPLKPKPYKIGIAPSHITTPTAPLFGDRVDDWAEVRENIDFYKIYSLQAVPPKWATKLPVDSFAAFVKKHGIAVDAEFGAFGINNGVDEGKTAATRARAMHAWLGHRGLTLRALHLDGPIRRMLTYKGKKGCSLSLEQAAEEVAVFLSECHNAFPGTQIGLITNFPNWHYTADHPGMLGSWTKRTGVHYLDVLEAVHRATRAKGTTFDFIEVDCPWNYYRATANRADPSRRVDNAATFKALQQWCRERDMEFWLIVNHDTNPQKVAGKVEMGNRFFHDGTLTYIRQLRRDGVFPDCFTIQSWYKLPDKHLPEGSGYSFMHTARDAVRLIHELFPEKAQD